ncbi:TPA: hypothetical protein OW314_006107 [Pseudomonas aeruginosa]|nr:hypothetical protein [Pseudomonas aeruginosa]HCW0232498.1 hypothetical protein [Pseudomonas aeruginosa]HCW0346816.1 hypothetical protein [Pseudomonas aeruginosa]
MDNNNVYFVAGNICRHLACALDQSKVMAAAREIAAHFAAQVQEAEPEIAAHRLLYLNHDGKWVTHGRPWVDVAPDEQLRCEMVEPSTRWKIEYAYTHPPRAQAEPAALSDDAILAIVRRYDPAFNTEPEGPTESYVIGLVRAVLKENSNG